MKNINTIIKKNIGTRGKLLKLFLLEVFTNEFERDTPAENIINPTTKINNVTKLRGDPHLFTKCIVPNEANNQITKLIIPGLDKSFRISKK